MKAKKGELFSAIAPVEEPNFFDRIMEVEVTEEALSKCVGHIIANNVWKYWDEVWTDEEMGEVPIVHGEWIIECNTVLTPEICELLLYSPGVKKILLYRENGTKDRLLNEANSSGAIAGPVTEIYENAFAGLRTLTSIIIPDYITTIGADAFSGCKNLKSVTIGKSVKVIFWSAFAECGNLKEIVVAKENKHYDSRDNCNAIIETKSNTLIAGCKNTVIPDSVTAIGDYAFSGCKR